MKEIHILSDIKDHAWGGGNQFLKTLRHQLRRSGRYAESIAEANVILFNSHHQTEEVIDAKIKYPKKHFVHRLGSVFTYARGDRYLDKIVIEMNKTVADGTVFQSAWQEGKYYEIGLPIGISTIIHNAPNNQIFNTRKEGTHDRDRIRIITTGWSTGTIKGFDIYKYLDEHLDFTKYQFIYLGNSKLKFNNIETFPPQDSRVVASMLKGSDIFITATQNDACSNSLVEALHCGLPVVVRNSGGNPELVGNGGLLFEGTEDVIQAIEMVSSNLEHFSKKINTMSDEKVADLYYSFCMYILENTTPKQYQQSDKIKHKLMEGRQKIGELIRVGRAKL